MFALYEQLVYTDMIVGLENVNEDGPEEEKSYRH